MPAVGLSVEAPIRIHDDRFSVTDFSEFRGVLVPDDLALAVQPCRDGSGVISNFLTLADEIVLTIVKTPAIVVEKFTVRGQARSAENRDLRITAAVRKLNEALQTLLASG